MKRMLAIAFPLAVTVSVAGTLVMVGWIGGVFAAQKNSTKLLLENEKVRVKLQTFVPGVQPGMHTHELPHVGVSLDDGKLRFNYPDGKTEVLELRRGTVGFRPANVTHEAVNVGKKPIRVIEVELKN